MTPLAAFTSSQLRTISSGWGLFPEQHGDRVTRAGVDVECADGEVVHPGQGGELLHAANDELFSGVRA